MRVTNRSSLDFEQLAELDLAALVENPTKRAGPKDREAVTLRDQSGWAPPVSPG